MKNNALRVLYLFAGERKNVIKQWQTGNMPDSYLVGYNHMADLGVQADYIENKFISWVRKKNFNLANLILIKKIREYDIVFSGGSLALPLLAKFILRFKKPKFVWYNTFFTNTLKRNRSSIKGWVIRKAIASLDAIVCPSTAQKDFLIKEGFDKNKIFYVPNGVDFDFINSFKINRAPEGSRPFILSVGKDLGRDYATLIEAVKNINIEVKIVALPRNFKKKERLPSNISVLSNVPFSDLLKLYKGALFVVIPTKSEQYLGSSDCSGQYVLLDSMAAGKAIIASERDTLQDYVTDNSNVITVPPEDPIKLKEAIIGLINNQALIAKLGDQAKKELKNNFTTKIMAKNLAKLFYRLFTNHQF